MIALLCLGACAELKKGVIVRLGVPTLVPAEVHIASDATAGSPGTVVRIALPIRYEDLEGNYGAPRLRLSLLGGLPAGLSLSTPHTDQFVPAPVPPMLLNSAVAETGSDGTVRTHDLQLAVTSLAAIGTVSPGRHIVLLEASLCGIPESTAANPTFRICDTRTAELVIVVGGAALPSAPADLAATPAARQVRLRWSADPAPDSYLLERALGSGSFATVATLAAPITERVDSGLDPATRYTYRLTPRNAAGNGPAATIEVQTLAEAGNGQVGAVVSGAATGTGRVSSQPAGIACPGDCTETYPLGSNVTLTATPAVGSVFEGWSGPADCADGVITVVAEIACTARFTLAPAGGRGWSSLGELLPSGGEAPLIAPQRGGDLHVALRRGDFGSGLRELVVLRQTGAQTWTLLGGGAPNGIASASSHGFVVDPAGRPVIAWSEAAAVRVARHENGVWTRLADNLRIGSGTPSQVQLEWRDGQAPVLSWVENDGGLFRLAVKRLGGDLALADGPWVGGYLPEVANLRGHRMVVDSDGLPSFVVSRTAGALQLPLTAWRVNTIGDGTVQAEALGGDITVSAGFAYQHDFIGYGIGHVLNFDGSSGAPVVLGARDARHAYARAYNTTSWVQAGQLDGVVDADGLVLDANPGTGEALLGVATLRTPGIALLLGVITADNATPDRVELLSLDGLRWIRPTDALSVPQLAAIGSGILDAADRPVVLTVEHFGAGGRGRIRAYQWTP